MQIRASQPNTGAGASALPLQGTRPRRPRAQARGRRFACAKSGRGGNHRSKTPGGPRAAEKLARRSAPPAPVRATSRTRPLGPRASSRALKATGGGGFLRGRRLLTRGDVTARPRSSSRERAGRPPQLRRGRGGSARPARGHAPSPAPGRRWRE